MENIKIYPPMPPYEIEAIAGPGHSPTSPHPAPNNKEPNNKSELIDKLSFWKTFVPSREVFILPLIFHAINIGRIAPKRTNASVGSQSPKKFSHP